MRKIIKLFRDKNPYGSGLVWCFRWSDGTEEYTIDSASGTDRFSTHRQIPQNGNSKRLHS